MNDDDDLRKAFENLRRDDARRLPDLDAMWRPPRRSPWKVIVPMAAAAALFVVWSTTRNSVNAPATTMDPRPSGVLPTSSRSPSPETGPLDFLLETRSTLALSTPDFDSTPRWFR